LDVSFSRLYKYLGEATVDRFLAKYGLEHRGSGKFSLLKAAS
jgi:hypothetical protein